jgi:hypothetical protein
VTITIFNLNYVLGSNYPVTIVKAMTPRPTPDNGYANNGNGEWTRTPQKEQAQEAETCAVRAAAPHGMSEFSWGLGVEK